jgi:type II secretory pathway predicted ATPase ExeA
MHESLSHFKERFDSLLHAPGIGLLTGEPGIGKTAVLRHITQDLNPHQYQVIYLAETQFTSFDIYRQLAIMLGIVPNHRFAQLWRDIKNHIKDQVTHKRMLPVLIIDEAQNLPADFFRSFPSFLNYAFDAKDMMAVWFVGHPILTNIIDRNIHTALASRIQTRHQLDFGQRTTLAMKIAIKKFQYF